MNLLDAVDSVQAVIAAGETLSRQMVKFAASIPVESLVCVIGTVKNAPEPVKSATVSNVELHIEELWIVSKARTQLPISVEDCERAVPSENVQEKTEEGGRPAVTLSTRLDNRVLDLRSTLNHAIFQIRAGVKELFQEYLVKHGFIGIDTPKLLGAPSEGGANVFEVKYFDTKAFLCQSPQLYKQMCIAAGFERVMSVLIDFTLFCQSLICSVGKLVQCFAQKTAIRVVTSRNIPPLIWKWNLRRTTRTSFIFSAT